MTIVLKTTVNSKERLCAVWEVVAVRRVGGCSCALPGML